MAPALDLRGCGGLAGAGDQRVAESPKRLGYWNLDDGGPVEGEMEGAKYAEFER